MHRSLARCCPAAVLALSLIAIVAGCSDQHDAAVNPPDQSQDTQPPLTPVMEQWAAKDGGPLTLNWSDNGEADLAGYNLYRYRPTPESLQSYTKINVGLIGENSYMVPDATPGVYEYYRVSSVDGAGNESALSGPVETSFHFGSQDQPPPIEPRNLP